MTLLYFAAFFAVLGIVHIVLPLLTTSASPEYVCCFLRRCWRRCGCLRERKREKDGARR